MPRFLLITIIILLLAGQIFAVKEYTPTDTEEENVVRLEDLYFNEENKEYGPIQIIESPTGQENIETMYINEGGECIFFDRDGIPWLDKCPDKIVE
jgi:hypothetical protein